MATNAIFKILGQSYPNASTLTTLYTTPTTASAVTSGLFVCNQTLTGSTWRLAVRPGGNSVSASNYIYYDTPIYSNETQQINMALTLSATDVVSCYASSSGVSFNLFGEELI